MIVWAALFALAAFLVTAPAQLFGWLCGRLVRRMTRGARAPPGQRPRQRDPP